MMRDRTIEERKAAFAALNTYVTSQAGWLTSVPGDVEFRMEEIIAKVNDLFEGDLTDDDQLVYVNNVIKGKLLESKELVLQASNNTKAQFANSPTLAARMLAEKI